MLFDNINRVPLEEPDAREVEDLKKSTSSAHSYSKKKSSVSFKTFVASKIAINVIAVLLILLIIGATVFFGIKMFIG